MTIGEKIRLYREMRGISQVRLANLSEINVGTIRKYELGIRIPKQAQLIKIANGLGINASVFYNLDISTVGDVMGLLLIIADITDIEFEGKDEFGRYSSDNIVLKFNKSIYKKAAL